MKLQHPGMQQQAIQDSFLNSSGLDAVRKMGRNDDPQAMREVARQFESLFVQQMFKSMRSANEAFGEDNFLNSSETDTYQQMLDQQLSLELTKGQGMGLADALYRQMMQSYGDHFDKEPARLDEPPAVDTSHIRAPADRAERARSTQVDEPDSAVQSFLDAVTPYARWAADALGINPQAVVAQAALETGWGKHVIRDEQGASSFNLFNIKAGDGWEGDSVSKNTREYVDGEATEVNAPFRRYQSLFESFSDYVNLLREPRYRQALAAGNDAERFAQELQRAGYATDPSYADKLHSILKRDEVAAVGEPPVSQHTRGGNG